MSQKSRIRATDRRLPNIEAQLNAAAFHAVEWSIRHGDTSLANEVIRQIEERLLTRTTKPAVIAFLERWGNLRHEPNENKFRFVRKVSCWSDTYAGEVGTDHWQNHRKSRRDPNVNWLDLDESYRNSCAAQESSLVLMVRSSSIRRC